MKRIMQYYNIMREKRLLYKVAFFLEIEMAKETKKQKEIWKNRFKKKVILVHKRNIEKVINKLLARIDRTKTNLYIRSAKYNVKCDITVNELRQLVLDAYGKKCKYCDKILTNKTFVIDHIIPISKGGTSTKDNLQIICKTSNSMKGSLIEEHYKILLDWLDTVPEELKKDISIRLARGIH